LSNPIRNFSGIAKAAQLPPAAPAVHTGWLVSDQNRQSQLGIAEPKRLRDKAHLKFVASQPCLVCGRQPSDSLHLRFAQPRAIGLKVSDESTVPLCRGRHRELHQVGIEEDWWAKYQIDTLEMVKHLWEQNHLQRT